jgi:electron transfer flavoprotein alpha subunit
VVAVGPAVTDSLSAFGADALVRIEAGAVPVEEDVAAATTSWASASRPWAILAPSTTWGREVASRIAAALSAGLTGDAVALEVDEGRLVAWKPAFGGQLVAAITASSPVQLATVRAGVLKRPIARAARAVGTTDVRVVPRGRVEHLAWSRDDDLDVLADADAVVGVGRAVPPDRYHELDPLLTVLGAELGATRKVTDEGWLPRARQIGITGRSIAPRLYVALGVSGKFNHMIGVRGAGTILAVNMDRDAPVFGFADVGIVADYNEVVPRLTEAATEVGRHENRPLRGLPRLRSPEHE